MKIVLSHKENPAAYSIDQISPQDIQTSPRTKQIIKHLIQQARHHRYLILGCSTPYSEQAKILKLFIEENIDNPEYIN